MHAQMNPNFYKGTVVEDAVAKHMSTLQKPSQKPSQKTVASAAE